MIETLMLQESKTGDFLLYKTSPEDKFGYFSIITQLIK